MEKMKMFMRQVMGLSLAAFILMLPAVAGAKSDTPPTPLLRGTIWPKGPSRSGLRGRSGGLTANSRNLSSRVYFGRMSPEVTTPGWRRDGRSIRPITPSRCP